MWWEAGKGSVREDSLSESHDFLTPKRESLLPQVIAHSCWSHMSGAWQEKTSAQLTTVLRKTPKHLPHRNG